MSALRIGNPMTREESNMITNQMKQDGYVIIRQAFSKEEIGTLKRQIVRHLSKNGIYYGAGKLQPNAAIELPEISWVLYHERLLEAIRCVLRTETLMFGRQCGISKNMLNGWHKDAAYRKEEGHLEYDLFEHPDRQMCSVAIYLEDHLDNRKACCTGLTVRKGSHLHRSLEVGEIERLETRAGDVVIIDVRLTHVGLLPDRGEQWVLTFVNLAAALIRKIFRLKLNEQILGCSGYLIRSVYRWFRRYPDRYAMLLGYGLPNETTAKGCRNGMVTVKKLTGKSLTDLPQEVIQRLREHKVLVAEYDLSKI